MGGPGRPAVASILVLVQANSPSQQASPAQGLLGLDREKHFLPSCAVKQLTQGSWADPEGSPVGYLVGGPRLVQPQNGYSGW